MNKFNFTKQSFKESFIFSIVLAAILLLASEVSDTPHHVVFFSSTIISFFIFFYLSFIESNTNILNKLLTHSAYVFFQLCFTTALSYLDFYLFGIQ